MSIKGFTSKDDKLSTELKDKKKWFIIEGNIGSGKTTLMKMLNERYLEHTEYIYEPVGVWQTFRDEKGTNLLDLFYSNQNRWAYTMQTVAFLTRMQDITRDQIRPLRFSERSVFTDIKVFAENCYLNGKMNKVEWDLYNSWFHWLTTSKLVDKLVPDGFIYVRAEPEKSMERLKVRGRAEEKTVPLEYLKDIHSRHDEWLLSKDMTTPVLVLDGNKDFLEDKSAFAEIDKQIQNFIGNDE